MQRTAAARLGVGILTMLLLSFALPVQVAKASTLLYGDDFAIGAGAQTTIATGSWSDSVGHNEPGSALGNAVFTSPNWQSTLVVQVDFESPYPDIVYVSAWIRQNDNSPGTFTIDFLDESLSSLGTYNTNTPTLSEWGIRSHDHVYEGVRRVEFTLVSGLNFTTATTYIDDILIYDDSGIYTRPLTSGDFDAWGMYENPDAIGDREHGIYFFSTSQGKPVFAATGGTVTTVRRITENDCSDLISSGGLSTPGNDCRFPVPAEVNGSGIDWYYKLKESDFLTPPLPGNLAMQAFLVEIDAGDRELSYIVNRADEYLTEGQTITAGCILGVTAEIVGVEIDIIDPIGTFIGRPAAQGAGFVAVRESGDIIDSIDEFVVNPSGNNACNVNPEVANCQGDAQLTRLEQWNISGDATIDNPGATLHAFSSIESARQYNLIQNREPRMRVSARSFGGTASMILTIGQTTETFEVSGAAFEDYEIAGDTHTPNASGFYSIIVTNDSSATIEIEYICVAHTLDEELDPLPPPQPKVCYFENNSFNEGGAGWTLSGGAVAGEGQIYVPDGETISQAVHLFPDTYRITVVAGLRFYVAYTPDETEATAQAEIEYEYPDSGGYTTIDNFTFGEIDLNRNEVTFTTTFVVGSETDDLFNLRAQLISPPGEVVALAIKSACIETGDGEPFPGYDEEPGEPQPELFPESCNAVEYPSGNSFGSWIQWQWAKFNQFHQCDLMVFLNRQYRTFLSFFNTVGYSIKWGQTTTRLAFQWFEYDVAPWLQGYFTNMSGNITVNYSGESNCDWWNIFCHATKALQIGGDLFGKLFDVIGLAIKEVIAPLTEFLIRILGGAADILFNVLNALLSLFFQFIAKVFEYLNIGRVIFFAILEGYNTSEPTTLPGLPDCSGDPGNNVFCLMIWASENTLLADDTPGALIIPLLTAAFAILLGLWFIRELKQTIIGAMNSV